MVFADARCSEKLGGGSVNQRWAAPEIMRSLIEHPNYEFTDSIFHAVTPKSAIAAPSAWAGRGVRRGPAVWCSLWWEVGAALALLPIHVTRI